MGTPIWIVYGLDDEVEALFLVEKYALEFESRSIDRYIKKFFVGTDFGKSERHSCLIEFDEETQQYNLIGEISVKF